MTDSEVLADKIERMGSQLGHYMHRLGNEYFWQRCDWRDYKSLFLSDTEKIMLLNETAPSFFIRVERALRESLILGIARFTDPHSKVLSLLRIPKIIEVRGPIEPSKLEKIQYSIEVATRKSEFATQWRNKYIAHRNSKFVLSANATLPEASRKSIDEAHFAISDVLNETELAHSGGWMYYSDILERGNAEVLLNVLSDGMRADAQRRCRFRNGTYTKKDIRNANRRLWTQDEEPDDD